MRLQKHIAEYAYIVYSKIAGEIPIALIMYTSFKHWLIMQWKLNFH